MDLITMMIRWITSHVLPRICCNQYLADDMYINLLRNRYDFFLDILKLYINVTQLVQVDIYKLN